MPDTFIYPSDEKEPLAASRTKLVRVRQLIQELQTEFEIYKNDDPVSAYSIVVGNEVTFQVKWKGTSLKAGAIIGDIIHNLRSALDLAATELARKYDKDKNDNNVYFPFSISKDDLDAAMEFATGELEMVVVGIHTAEGRLEKLSPVPDPRHGGGAGSSLLERERP